MEARAHWWDGDGRGVDGDDDLVWYGLGVYVKEIDLGNSNICVYMRKDPRAVHFDCTLTPSE